MDIWWFVESGIRMHKKTFQLKSCWIWISWFQNLECSKYPGQRKLELCRGSKKGVYPIFSQCSHLNEMNLFFDCHLTHVHLMWRRPGSTARAPQKIFAILLLLLKNYHFFNLDVWDQIDFFKKKDDFFIFVSLFFPISICFSHFSVGHLEGRLSRAIGPEGPVPERLEQRGAWRRSSFMWGCSMPQGG